MEDEQACPPVVLAAWTHAHLRQPEAARGSWRGSPRQLERQDAGHI